MSKLSLVEFKEFQPVIDQRALLSPLSLQIQPGEFVVIAARSGSGKTRLLETVGNHKLEHKGAVIVRAETVTVPQSLDLCLSLTGEENAALASLASVSSFRSLFGLDSMAIARAREHLAALGVTCPSQSVGLMSGGEQQRVALARLLLSPRTVWLIDEPVSQLDDEVALHCLRHVKREAQARNAAVLCALHQLHLAPTVADRVLIWEGQWKAE